MQRAKTGAKNIRKKKLVRSFFFFVKGTEELAAATFQLGMLDATDGDVM